jgi:hypothetical protein
MVMMNKLTRKLAKIPDEVRKELQPFLVDRMPILNEDGDEQHKRSLSISEKLSDGNNAERHLIKGLTVSNCSLICKLIIIIHFSFLNFTKI